MDPRTQLPLLGDGDPPEIVVHDELEPCPYLDGREARMPLRLPLGTLTRAQADLRFAAGDRRHGVLLYRTRCVGCAACVPLRVPIASFEPSRSMRRVLRRGDALLECSIAEPVADQSRLALYEEHKTRRGLLSKGAPKMTLPALRGFLVDRCSEAFEMRYHLDGELVGVALVDRGERALSAVYTYFDPSHPGLSIGTYSILKQIELCRTLGLEHLYLGLYVEENAHMRYKARFRPHERLVGGTWRSFDSA